MKFRFVLILLFCALTIVGVFAQKKPVIPDPIWEDVHWIEGDNQPQIQEVLNRGYSPFLVEQGDWDLGRPIIIPKGSVGLAIGGYPKARLNPVYNRRDKDAWIENGQYREVIWAFDVVGFRIQNIGINLTNLPMTAAIGNYAITLWRANYSVVESVKIFGDIYEGDEPFIAGGDAGGVCINYSKGVEVRTCYIRDVGAVSREIGASIPNEGIRICGSNKTKIVGNRILRVAIAIEVVGNERLEYHSSDTQIIDNEIVGVDESDNPYTPSSRGIKIQVCGSKKTPTPARGLKILRNRMSHVGGHNGTHGGVGIYVICGLQDSQIEDNLVDGCALQEFGLELASDYFGRVSTTQNNTFNRNDIRSGRGRAPCNSGCADVVFSGGYDILPDQVGLGRYDAGDNLLRTGSIRK